MARLKACVALLCSGLVLCVCVPALAGLLSGSDDNRFLPVDQAFQPRAMLKDNAVVVTWRIAPGYYLYRHALSFQTPGETRLGQPRIPNGQVHFDAFFGRVETYRNFLRVKIPVISDTAPKRITVSYQGCADAGLCYPPQTRTLALVAGSGTATTAEPDAAASGPVDLAAEPNAETVFRPIGDLDELRAALNAAARHHRPALVVFYADWCVACVRMERTVFSDPRVRELLEGVAALRVDVTAYGPADRAIMQAHDVIGPPTMLFFGRNGHERERYRLIGRVDTARFIQHLTRALAL